MYHYVREIKKSKYPNLKDLEFIDYKKQIDFFCKNFNIISKSDIIGIIHTKKIHKKNRLKKKQKKYIKKTCVFLCIFSKKKEQNTLKKQRSL